MSAFASRVTVVAAIALTYPCELSWAAPSTEAHLSGPISSASVAAAVSEIEAGARTLVITSGGGNLLDAIALGRVLHERHIALTVSGYCFSACASFVIPGAASVTISPQGLVAAHNTATSMYYATSQRYLSGVPAVTISRVAAEKAYYKALEVPQRLLLLPMLQVTTLCAGVMHPHDSTATPYVMTKYLMSVPSTEALKTFNPHIEGRMPTTDAELLQDENAVLPPDRSPQFTLVLGQDDGAQIAELQRRLRALPQCQGAGA